MSKADLHCHSIYSEHPSEWFLQRLGAKESYSDPFNLYKIAIAQGMDYVTITDHNRIEGVLMLKEKYGNKIITGVEATTYFPEDKCKVHILIYGFTEVQFAVINYLRSDIYELRDYLKQENLTHSVAHASYSVNGKLNREHLEKLILLFDTFEGINGGRVRANNMDWMMLTSQLTPNIIDTLYAKYKIEPYSHKSWQKGFTAGSDDHAGLFIGRTWTEAEGKTAEQFLHNIRHSNSLPHGRHNTYHALAFTIYKIAWDFSGQKTGKSSEQLLGKISEQFFNNKGLDLADRIKLKTMKSINDIKGDQLKSNLLELIEALHFSHNSNIDNKLDIVYDKIAGMADSFFMMFLDSLEADLHELNLIKIVRNISAALPGIFLLLPFFSSLKHMHQNRNLLSELKQAYKTKDKVRKKRTLWFTDTLVDLNGVSVTLNKMGSLALENGWDVQIVTSLTELEMNKEVPSNLINLPFMYLFQLPFYELYKIKIPSILRSIKTIHDLEPDQIIISTPGPIGMIALIAAKMMQVKCIGIYHTDFVMEADHIIKDESAISLLVQTEKWFYNQMDEIRVPTNEYINILRERGITVKKMELLLRGIETDVFYPYPDRFRYFSRKKAGKEGITLLYTGRISLDKSLDLLIQTYLNLLDNHPDLHLIIAGEGPYLNDLRKILSNYEKVTITGIMPRNDLAELYNAADFFVFPSITDTFGMVILESQACGLPAIVSNQGGPKEIIQNGETGFVVPDQKTASWVNTLEHCFDIYKNNHSQYLQMRHKSRDLVIKNSNWKSVLDNLLGDILIA